MKFQGKVIKIYPQETIERQSGDLYKQVIVFEIPDDKYPKKVAVTSWGERDDVSDLIVGDEAVVHINLESKEYNDKWYNNVSLFKLDFNVT